MTLSPQSHPDEQMSSQQKIWAVVVFFAVISILVLMGARLLQNDDEMITPGESPKDFTLTTFAGKQIQTEDLRGKVVLINFWASWCVTCDEEALLLEEAWQSFQTEGSEQVMFLGVAYMDTESAALDFLSEYGVTYPNGPDLRGEISKIYQVNTVPETYILDREGVLSAVKFGPYISVNEIIAAVNTALAKESN